MNMSAPRAGWGTSRPERKQRFLLPLSQISEKSGAFGAVRILVYGGGFTNAEEWMFDRIRARHLQDAMAIAHELNKRRPDTVRLFVASVSLIVRPVVDHRHPERAGACPTRVERAM